MKQAVLHVLGFVTAALFVLGAAPACADAVGPYYATPSWDQTLPASTRFVVLSNFNSQAVLDRETGLVWERTPSIGSGVILSSASLTCHQRTTGGRTGWRLPAWNELASLFDPSQTVLPFLPPGHPFFFPSVTSDVVLWTISEAAGFPGEVDIIVLAINFFGKPALLLDRPALP